MSRRDWAIFLVGLAAVGGLVASTLGDVKYQSQADEGYYLRYAARIAQEGPGAFPALFQAYLQGAQSSRYFPNPIRVTTILLQAAVARLAGPTFRSLSGLSLAAFLALLALMFAWMSRIFDRRTAITGVLLMAASPLHLLMARRALADTLISAAMMGCLWLLFRALWGTPRRGIWRWAAFLYAVAFLVKESSLILIPISLTFIAWRAVDRRQPFPWREGCAVSVVPLALAGAVMLLAAGGWHTLWETLRMSRGAYSSPFAQAYLQGPWFRYVADFLIISPWVTILYLVWLGTLVGSGEKDERVWFWVVLPVLFILFASLFPLRHIRYAMVLEIPMRVGIALLLRRLPAQRLSARWAAFGTAVVLAGLILIDVETFRRFVEWDVYEPTNLKLLLVQRFLVPPTH